MNNLTLLSIIIASNGQEGLAARLSYERRNVQMLLIDINEQMYRLASAVSSSRQRHHANMGKPIFTLRENDVLYWASMGKTYGEIAVIADISVSTVKFHMSNIVAKLGNSNVRQAIRLGVEFKLLTPPATAAK